ncbi:MAG: MlaD family protein [Acidimicrobiales bacterium]
MSRRTLINLIFFAGVFVVMLAWAVQNVVTLDVIENPYEIAADFEAASGILPGAEVAYLGVNYGRVSNVDRMVGGVRVTMKIDKDEHIPAGSIARIFRKSAVGEPYIDFKPPPGYSGDAGPFIVDGDTVPMDDTRIPLEFSELLRSASALIGGIDPQQAGTLIHELALALDGRAQSLRQLTLAADQLSASFAAKTDVLDRLSTNSTRLTAVVADHRASLGNALTNLSLLAESLRNADGNTQVLLDRGTQLVGTVADLVGDTKSNLDCFIKDLVPVMETVAEPSRLEGTAFLLDNGATGFGNLWDTRDEEADGVWVRTNLIVNTEEPATDYEPNHPLPAVPAVGACTSALTSAGPDFVPSDVRAAAQGATGVVGSVSSIAATGGVSLLWLAAMLVLGAAVVRRLIRARHAGD